MKKFWLPVLQMAVASLVAWGANEVRTEFRASREWRVSVDKRLVRIETALKIKPETDEKYAQSNP